ncbi:hypothetical protein QCA50_019334 [Cerrena zonata]|uniref:Cytochrome P450 n=1 Tax=Cerrena zonata TaxID=2478898 RepID=A0AAW0FJ53_9APHY
MSTILLVFLSGSLGWLLWLVARNFVTTSPLDKIPGPKSASLLKGNLGQLLDRHGWDFIEHLGTRYNKVVRLTGLFGHTMLYVFDPKALHHIIIKDAEVYDLPEWSTDGANLTLGPGLLSVHGAHHRKQRKMLNPVFSIKHMRMMTPLFYNVAHKLRNGLEAQVGNGPTTVDILNWFGRTALELIGQGGLGYTLDPLDSPAHNEYGDAIKEFLPALFESSQFQPLLKYAKRIGSPAFRAAAMDWIPLPGFRRLKQVVMKMDSEARRIYELKKDNMQAGDQGLLKQVGEGKDIMSHLLRANMAAPEEDRLPEEEIVGQMSLLVMAGTDTTSNSLVQLMQLLSQYPKVQESLRAEIKQAQEQHGDDIPYDVLVSLPYMDAICRETLRLYPPPSFIFREAQKDIVMPLSEPITCMDGTVMNEIPVPAGTTVIVGILASNRNVEIWGDDVAEFKPERWLSPLPASVTEAHIPGVYSNLMTFNGGGRACIGFKFSQLEMKVVLSTIVSSFKISLSDEAEDIVWNVAAVRYPTVGKDSTKPEFPLRLEPIKV